MKGHLVFQTGRLISSRHYESLTSLLDKVLEIYISVDNITMYVLHRTMLENIDLWRSSALPEREALLAEEVLPSLVARVADSSFQ